jgi:transposase-like protein
MVSQIERDLGITPGLLHKWTARMKTDGQQTFPLLATFSI